MKQIYELHADVCKTLANPKRIEILSALRNDELSAGDLQKALGIKKANLSQHLAVMRNKGIVLARRDGVNIYYRVANPKVTQACDLMREVLTEHLKAAGKLARRSEKL